jgi:hypothetical protein
VNYSEYVVRIANHVLAIFSVVAVFAFGVGGLLLQILVPIAVALHFWPWAGARRPARR